MEMNTRLQVEHTVTENITGIDIVQEQIRIADGLPLQYKQEDIRHRGFAMEFRINAEDPQNSFLPSFGRITRYYAPGGPGVRTDAAMYSGYTIPPYYDSMCAKLTVWALNWEAVIERGRRALDDMKVYGVKTTIPYYQEILLSPDFRTGRFNTGFVDAHPELLNYAVNRPPEHVAVALSAAIAAHPASERKETTMTQVKITDLVLRDGHQSLIATRMRTEDMLPICGKLDSVGFWSLEAWGGATFDACVRFLKEDPWERLRKLRKALPNTPHPDAAARPEPARLPPLPDDVVRAFVQKSADNGVDVFRVFDAMNDIRNMRVSIEAVKAAGKHAEGTLSYTTSPVHDIPYFVAMARHWKPWAATRSPSRTWPACSRPTPPANW
jgi:pyruvate carboxylase